MSKDKGSAADVLTDIHSQRNPVESITLTLQKMDMRNEVTSSWLSQMVETESRESNRMPDEEGLPKKPTPLGKPKDMLT
jgi:hypothetical protein